MDNGRNSVSDHGNISSWKQFTGWLGERWRDYTGQTQVQEQNAANLALANYQSQMQEEYYKKYSSPQALMQQYKDAGLNPNLVYGSASAGQGNVPGFNAPNVERMLSGSDKVNKALSLLSGVSGVVTSIYNAAAAREAAEQSGVKTLRDIVGLAKDEGDLRLQNTLYGSPLYDNMFVRKFGKAMPYIGTGSGGYLSQYSKNWRDSQINNFIKSGLLNAADFGVYAGSGNGKLQMTDVFGTPYYRVRNAQNALRFRLSKQLGNQGVYGKLAISLLDTLL